MAKDLRGYLEQADRLGALVRLTRPADSATEIGALMHELAAAGKVGLFEQVAGKEGRIACNLLGRREFLAAAMGVTVDSVVPAFRERMAHPIPPIAAVEAPVHEVVQTGDDCDLTRFPFLVHSEKDAGAYISAGLVVARDPETGLRNVSINRMQVREARKTGIRMMPPQHLGVIQAKAEQRGERLPVAVVLGNHPLDVVAAATSLPFGADEFGLAGALRGEPLALVRGITVDLEVPATAELVLEGYVEPGAREEEGPFGDFLQYYVPVMKNHVFRLSAITHRRNPILQAIHAGSREDVNLLGISREAQVLQAVLGTGAHVGAVRLLPTILGGAISIRQRYQGEAKAVGMAALGAYRWLKYVVVVDHDVDVNDLEDVWWAVNTRSNPAQALSIIDRSGGFPRDPFQIHTGKAVIDATIPLGEWAEFERKRPPNLGKVRLKDFL